MVHSTPVFLSFWYHLFHPRSHTPQHCNEPPLLQTVTSSSNSMMNSTFNVDSADDSNATTTTDNKADNKAGNVLSSLENRKSSRNSKTKLLDKLKVEEVRSSEEFEQPTTMPRQRSKRSGEIAFKELEESSKESTKRKRTMFNVNSSVSYFGPLS